MNGSRLTQTQPRASLQIALASLAPIYKHSATRRTPARWDVHSESANSLPLWEATDRREHARLSFVFAGRIAYIETLRALSELWTLDASDTFTLTD